MSLAAITDTDLMALVVHATLERARRKEIALSVAAENILNAAARDFFIPAERLPERQALIDQATLARQTDARW